MSKGTKKRNVFKELGIEPLVCGPLDSKTVADRSVRSVGQKLYVKM